jgi:hypothetical protein
VLAAIERQRGSTSPSTSSLPRYGASKMRHRCHWALSPVAQRCAHGGASVTPELSQHRVQVSEQLSAWADAQAGVSSMSIGRAAAAHRRGTP